MGDNTENIRSQMEQSRALVEKITQPTSQLNLISKVNEVIENLVIDDTLSTTSENPVQNKVITLELNTKAPTSLIPTKTSQLANDSNFISTVTSADVTTALGYTPYNSSNPSGYEANKIDTIKVNGTAQTITSKTVDITIPAQQTVGDGNMVIQRNGTAAGTFTANQTTASTINISVPTKASDVGALPDTTVIGNANMVIRRNNTAVGTFTANQTTASTVNISVPTTASEVGALPDTTSITDLASATQLEALNSGVNSTVVSQVTTNKNNIASIQTVIPTAATATNQLADKEFVNSSIATNTAYFIGTFNSVAELEAYSGTLTNNDYAFVATTDTAGNTLYDRYKYNADTQEWMFEYELNNSSFTSVQWAAINSGVTTTVVEQVTTNKNEIGTIKSTLSTFGNIVTHSVAEFATAAQGSLADSALQPNDNISELTNDAGYITGITSGDVTTALGYTPYNSTNPDGYQANVIETVKVNGTALSPTTKTVDIIIPAQQTVGDGNMVIQRNGSAVGTFTANQTSAKTINISVPTTAADVGALPDTTVIGAGNLVIQRNSSAIGTFGANQTTGGTINISVPTTAADVGALPDTTVIGSGNVTIQRNGTAVGTVNANATANSAINISVPTTASDVGALPDTTVIGNGNMVLQRNGSAIGTFTANQTAASTINVSVPTKASDIGALPDTTTIGSAYLTIKRNGTAIGSFGANATTAVNVDITVPTATSDLTNDSGYITGISGSDVTTALGYTPYNSSNPSGYQANVIETVKVNGTALSPTTKTVDITIPAQQTVGNGNMVIQRNGTAAGTFTANQTAASTINISVPTTASDVGALPDTTFIPTVVNTYSATGTDAISGTGVAQAINGLIKKTDLSATAPITYNNSTGVISANIDTTVGTHSNYLVSSGAVKSYVDSAIVGGVLYQGTWTATGQTSYSGITLPVKKGYLYYVEGSATIGGIEWNTGDFLLINADVAAGGTISDVSKIDNTESTDIVRLNATQTLTNKTISADSNNISNLTTSNLKSGVLATSVRATATASNTVIVSEKGIADALAGKADSSDIPIEFTANEVQVLWNSITPASV